MICPDFASPEYLVFAEGVSPLVYYSHFSSIIVSLLVGGFVYFSDKKALLNRLLLLISLVFSLWTFMSLITWTSNESDVINFDWSFDGAVYIMLCFLVFYFFAVFAEKKDLGFWEKLVSFFLLLPMLVLAPSRYNLPEFPISKCGPNEGAYFTNYYYAVGLLMFLWVLFYAVRGYRRAKSSERKPLLIMTLGVEFFLLAFFINGFLASYLVDKGLVADYSLDQYGLFGMTFFMAVLAYLIVKFKAFDIKLLGTQALVFALAIVVGSQFFFVRTTTNTILTAISFSLVIASGYFLIKSVKREVAQREEIEKLYVTLAVANEKLQKLDNAKSEFISIASHQLRTPLTAIKGYVSLVLEGAYGAVSTELQDVLNKVYIANSRLSQLVENMLNISRIEAGRIQYNFSEGRIEPLMNELRDVFILAAKNRGLELTVDLPKEPLPLIEADMSKLREAFSNMIDNALKYTEKGGVTISAGQSGNGVEVRIRDTGMGIDPEEAKNLFQKFSRGKESTKINVSSTGLGLYIVKQFIEAHKGTVRIESEGKGKGTTFVVRLPIKG